MTSRLSRAGILALGLALVGAGQHTAAHPALAATVVRSLLHAQPMAPVLRVFPLATALGLISLLIGALVVAAAIGLPPGGDVERRDPVTVRRSAHCLTPVIYVLLGVAGLLVLLCAYLLRQPVPETSSIAAWCGALLTMLAVTVIADRRRGTSFGNPMPSWSEWVLVVLLVIGDLILVGHDLTHWAWAGLPDEAHFFTGAKAFAEGRLERFLLSEDGVFGYHPVLSSYYQVLFMKLFGVNIFAWRFSSAAALALSLPAVYVLTRELCSRRAGYMAAVLCGSAQLAVSYAHWGYNNAQVYPVLTGSLAALAWSIRRRTLTGYYFAGCVAGFGFYTFYPARLSVVLVFLLAWSLGSLSFRRRKIEVTALALGILITILPVLAHPGDAMAHMLRQTAVNSGAQTTSAKIFGHWLESVLYASWFRCPGNFDWNPVVDPIAAALAVVGLWLGALALIRRQRSRFLLPAYLLSAFVLGAISQYDCPPLTRLLALTPFTAMLAAIALDQLMRRVSDLANARRVVSVMGAGLVAGAVIWNVTVLHHSIYEQHHGYGDGTTAELIRMTLDLPSNYKIVFIQRGDSSMYDVDRILAEYGWEARSIYIRPFSGLVEETVAALTPPFAVLYDLRSDEETHAVEALLARRFPEQRWHDSDHGKSWNLRYLCVPDRERSPGATP